MQEGLGQGSCGPSSQRLQQGWVWVGTFPAVTRRWEAVTSPFMLTPLFSLPDFWREAPRGHGLDHAHFRRPVHIWRSQWVPLHLLPVSAVQALPGPEATLLCILLCVYVGGLVSVSGVLYGHLGGDLAGGDCSHEGVCVCLCGHGGTCAARVVTHDVCGFSCGGKKHHPTSRPEEQRAEESPGCVLGNRTVPCLQPQSPFPTCLEAGCAGWKGTPL